MRSSRAFMGRALTGLLPLPWLCLALALAAGLAAAPAWAQDGLRTEGDVASAQGMYAAEVPVNSQTEQARELWTFGKTNFARIAEDMGALGIRVENAQAFPAALAQALAANRPAVIDVVTDIDALAPVAVT